MGYLAGDGKRGRASLSLVAEALKAVAYRWNPASSTSSKADVRTEFRDDIQALRGIAVGLVLIYHFELFYCRAGFLGVDIFFVISGFLITRMILNDIDAKRISIAGFYARRIKRLMPTAFVVYVSCVIAGLFFLTSDLYADFVQSLYSSILFVSNIYFWKSINYFTGEATLKPLIHTWSLSVEEQFYFFVPAALWLLPVRHRWGFVAVAGVTSFVACEYLLSRSPAATFYLLPTRAWELALGGYVAIARGAGTWKPAPGPSWEDLKQTTLVALLALVPTISLDKCLGIAHPGLDAVLVCLITARILDRKAAILERGTLARVLIFVGAISYPLYLVHWPLASFARSAYLDFTPPEAVRWGLAATAIVLALAVHKTVESPLRGKSVPPWHVFGIFLACAAVLVLSAYSINTHLLTSDRFENIRQPNYGYGIECESNSDEYNTAGCIDRNNPKMLVWGDSYAMHLVGGLSASTKMGVREATRSYCGPFLGIAPENSVQFNERWAHSCVAFNNSVLKFLEDSPQTEVVVLSSLLRQYVEPGMHGLRATTSGFERVDFDQEILASTVADTVARIRRLGKRVVIVGPTPSSGFNTGACVERKRRGLFTFGPNRDCIVDRATAVAFRQRTLALLERVSSISQVGVVNLFDFLCDEKTCMTSVDDYPLYRDMGHFTIEGSSRMGAKYRLADKVLSVAR
jgi:peptidoglycan/LPS O-acetylase OafA/YrhL